MMKPDREVLRQTGRLALGVTALVGAMLAVYAIIGRLKLQVVFGGIYSGALGVLNFFLMGLMVHSIVERAAEKERSDEEIAELSLEMKRRMQFSRNARMVALFGLLVLGIVAFHFDALATILPVVFPSVVVRVLQIMEARKAPEAEGSEKL